LQLLAGAILIGALGGGVMLIQHSAGADATRAKVAAAPQVAATRPPAPSPSPSPSPAPFIVRRILDLRAPLHHGDFVWDESGARRGRW
jgi:hypothetical protein